MLFKFRKLLKFVPQFFTVLGAVSVAFAMLLSMVNTQVNATVAQGGVIEWEGNGSDNLPCTNGVTQWNFTAGQDITSATLTVNGSNYSMSLNGGVWKAWVSNLVAVDDAYVTYTGELGNGNSVLTISHCTPGSTTPTNTPVLPTLTPSDTPTNTPIPPTLTPSETPTNTPIPDDPGQTPTPVTSTATSTPINTEVSNTATPINTEVPNDPDPTGTPVTDETPDPTGTPATDETPVPTGTPVLGETPNPTEPPDTEDSPEPTLAPPVSNDPPVVLIPVTGIELGGNSPHSDAQNFIFNMGLSFLGLGLVLQSVRKRFNF